MNNYNKLQAYLLLHIDETIDILKGGAYLEGVKKTIIILVNKNLLSISDAAKELGICEKDFKLLMEQQ